MHADGLFVKATDLRLDGGKIVAGSDHSTISSSRAGEDASYALSVRVPRNFMRPEPQIHGGKIFRGGGGVRLFGA